MWNKESKEQEHDAEMQEMSHKHSQCKQPKLEQIKTEEIMKDSS